MIERSKDWWMKKVALEGDSVVGAGVSDAPHRPRVSDADEWQLYLQEMWEAGPVFLAVQIVEAIEEHQRALAREIYGLREHTEAECEGVARLDLEGKQGAFARGRMYEAKGIARAINAIMPYSRDPSALSPTDGAPEDPPKVRHPNLHTEKDHGHG